MSERYCATVLLHPRAQLIARRGDVRAIGSFESLHRANKDFVHKTIEAHSENARDIRP